jgi:hypothetical protein
MLSVARNERNQLMRSYLANKPKVKHSVLNMIGTGSKQNKKIPFGSRHQLYGGPQYQTKRKPAFLDSI